MDYKEKTERNAAIHHVKASPRFPIKRVTLKK